MNPSTFYRWLKDGDDAKSGVKCALCMQLKEAESEYKRSLLVAIMSAVMSRVQYWTVVAWSLERKDPMEYSEMERKDKKADARSGHRADGG